MASLAGLGCGEPPATESEHGYSLTRVAHVLVADGRRAGELTADSVRVLGDGNGLRAWNVVVTLTRGPLEVRAESMTVDWVTHEMRYYGRVEITSGGETSQAEDLTVTEW